MHVFEIIRPIIQSLNLSAYGSKGVYLSRAPQGASEDNIIIIQTIDDRALKIKDGQAAMDSVIAQIDIYRANLNGEKNMSRCIEIAEIVRNAIGHYQSSNASIYYDSSSNPTYDTDIERWRISQDYKILNHR